eukprot:gnl/TRDRNA2_/TRDRNA2_167871_c8_seq2.p1 gnl/TRDRNA2_/TRDRNA2_167871_c8~~gnl/TRDRNA2_/TRDRNA2_167871_c8_seq2.p1  ORF type:complete len:404 (+),score=44.91 gnl/TRDRNA2_/TRDRNA2_167871_c8_seq2:153-1364(+)
MDQHLQSHITRAVLGMGRKRDRQGAAKPTVSELLARQDVWGLRFEQPYTLVEGCHWFALYKPPFWQVNDSKEAKMSAAWDTVGIMHKRSEGVTKDMKLQTWLPKRLASDFMISNDATESYGLLHRLDVHTSGILLCAKSYTGAYWIMMQWNTPSTTKDYVSLVHGWLHNNVTEVRNQIRVEHRSPKSGSTYCTVSDSGRSAYTEVANIAHFSRLSKADDDSSEKRFSLVVLKLHTGRTHQIRVHMLAMGHPLVCDVKYAETRFAADRTWCPRNFLHTYHLGFQDVPEDGRLRAAGQHRTTRRAERKGEETPGTFADVSCPLPEDLRTALAELVPNDRESAARLAPWLSGNAVGLRSFEQYTRSPLSAKQGDTPAKHKRGDARAPAVEVGWDLSKAKKRRKQCY